MIIITIKNKKIWYRDYCHNNDNHHYNDIHDSYARIEGDKYLDKYIMNHLISVLSSMGVFDMPNSEGRRYMEGFFFLPLQEED